MIRGAEKGFQLSTVTRILSNIHSLMADNPYKN